MFIRKAKTRRKTGEGSYTTYRLVRSERVGGRVRQVALLNLGTDFSLPKQQWRNLTKVVEALLAGSGLLLEPNPELRAVAERIVAQLRARNLDASETGAIATVDLASLDHERVRSVGCERLASAALEQLRFAETLRMLGVGSRDARIATALIIARMVHPSSEREALRWLQDNSATFELLGLESGKPISLNKLYRICDLLWKHHDDLENALFARERDLFQLPGTVVFFDLTNTHLTGRPVSTIARFGRSKQKRNDCPLVTLALSMDAAGFPRRSDILPGNVSEPGTLADAVGRLEAQAGDGPKPTVIMDAGISTEDNLAWLHERGYNWITVRRGRAPRPERAADAAFRTRAGHDAEIWRLNTEGGEARLCIWSHERQQKDDAMLAKAREGFESELRKLHDGLSKKNCVKRYDKVLERLGRLRERYQRINRQYDIEVKPGEKGLASAVVWKRNDLFAERDDEAGMYVLRTSHVDWDLETVVRTYWKLTELEATFRSLKSEIGLRPVWHSKTSRICSHLFIAVLAWHGVHLLRTRLAAHGLHESWETIRNRLAGWVRITSTIKEVDGSNIVIRQDARPDVHASAIAHALGIRTGPCRQCNKM